MLVSFSDQAVQRSVLVLRDGGVIAYPTETVYGLGCDAMNLSAIERIRDLKGRDDQKPMLVLIQKQSDLPALAQNISEGADALMKMLWPGPLTLLFEATPFVPKPLVGNGGTVGVRVSPDAVCEALLAEWKKPLVSTSANPSSEPPAQSGHQVQKYFSDKIDIILDDAERNRQNPSTVVDVTGREPKVLREGSISIDLIHKIWEPANG